MMDGYFDLSFLDDRAIFANTIFKLIYTKYNGDMSNVLMLSECWKIYHHLYNHVRNIYVIIDDEIPMMAYLQVLKNGAKGYAMWEEMSDQEALKIIEHHCHKAYS